MKRLTLIAALAAATLLSSCNFGGHRTDVDAEYPSKSQIDSVSYLIGINFGYFIKQNGFGTDLNDSEIKKGMYDFINATGNMYDPAFNEQFKISPEIMNQVLSDFVAKLSAYEAAVALKDGEEFLKANKSKDGVEICDNGLQYKIIKEGDEDRALPTDEVRVGYVGTLIDGTEFDSNEDCTLRLTNVIPGWSQGLQLVGAGGEIELYIPAELAYGQRSMGTIKPNSTLVFRVKLHEIKHTEAK